MKQINSIKIKEGGMKGLVVTYIDDNQEVNGKVFADGVNRTRKIPVGEELDGVIKAFRYYMYDVYGYDMEDVNVADMEMLEISAGFRLRGNMKILDGASRVPMDTKVIGPGYEKWEEVNRLLGQLWEKVGEYMDGKSMMRDRVLLEMYYEKKPMKEGELDFDGMGEEEVEMRAREVLEKLGGIVIMPSDMEVSVSTPPDNKPVISKEKPVEVISKKTTIGYMGTKQVVEVGIIPSEPMEGKITISSNMLPDPHNVQIMPKQPSEKQMEKLKKAASAAEPNFGASELSEEDKAFRIRMEREEKLLLAHNHPPIEEDEDEDLILNITPVKAYK